VCGIDGSLAAPDDPASPDGARPWEETGMNVSDFVALEDARARKGRRVAMAGRFSLVNSPTSPAPKP